MGTVPVTGRPSLVDRSVDRGHRPKHRETRFGQTVADLLFWVFLRVLGMFPLEHQVSSSPQAHLPTSPTLGRSGGPSFSGDPIWVEEIPDEEQVHRPCPTSVDQGHRPKNRYRAPTQGTASILAGIPWLSPAVSPVAWLAAESLTEVTCPGCLHVACRYSFRSRFSRGSNQRSGPTAPAWSWWVANFLLCSVHRLENPLELPLRLKERWP